jgi:hypothetical protein
MFLPEFPRLTPHKFSAKPRRANEKNEKLPFYPPPE